MFMKSSNYIVSFPFGNSITEGVLELVICYEFPFAAFEAAWFCYSKLLAEAILLPLITLFLLGIIPGLISSLFSSFDLLSLLDDPIWLLLPAVGPIPFSLIDIPPDF
jgi:hypothetical protein|tara:strand:+ start:619 stop:939 length:321 start_codon:yes stop_codon:yes gene_type:complete